MAGKRKPRILVIGSFMMDLVVRTPRAPEKGETVIGTSFSRFPGGKGANQAVAAARLGAAVTMAGKLGEDAFGDQMLKALQNEGVDVDHVLRDSSASTGVGSITLDDQGNNRIVVVPGANFKYNLVDLASVEKILPRHDLVMLQLEMSVEVVKTAVKMGRRSRIPVVLNPAPALELDDELLAAVTYLTPNEVEAELLTGVSVTDLKSAEKAAKLLLKRGPKHVVITLGENGVLAASADSCIYVPAYSVAAVDTVAAGDAFNGALATAVAQGLSFKEAVKFANAAGAVTVTREGAIPSLPTRQEVEVFLKVVS